VNDPKDPPSPSQLLPIPDNGLLLHIGVFKTGTTALQETMRRSRKTLNHADVLFRGPRSWKWKSLRRALTRNATMWVKLTQSVHAHDGRAFVSAESLCVSSEKEAKTAVAGLGRGRPVHILITVRSLADMLPSTWQQFLKRGRTVPYEDWLQSVLSETNAESSAFWERNNFPGLLKRWGDLVGEENITIVVSDRQQPDRILRVTEQLLDLTPESLKFHAASKTNRSLSYAEAELLRQVNAQATDLLSEHEYSRLVRLGVFPALHRRAGPHGDRIPLPGWAADAVAEIGTKQAEILRASSATIVGDIDAIARSSVEVRETIDPPELVPMDVASAAVAGSLVAAHRELNRPPS
jgi:hypothetical protein